MRRKDRTIIIDAVWAAYERGKAQDGLSPSAHNDLLKALDEAGFEVVRKGAESKWEAGFRSVAGALFYDPKAPCDIEAIVQEVRELRDIVPPQSDEAARRTECMTFCEDNDSWVVSGSADDVQKVLDLISEAEAARKLANISTRFEWTQRPPETVSLEMGLTTELPPGAKICTEEPGRLYKDTDSIGNLRAILEAAEGRKLEREKVKLARATASVDTTSGPIDLPGPVAKVTVATDTTPDGTNVCIFGWSEDGSACWLLNHTFVPSMRSAA